MAPLSRLATSVAVVISLVLVHGSTPTGPVKLTKAAADAAIKEIERDRADTQKWLRTDPTSYLAAIARQDFGGRSTLTVGSAADNDVRVGAPDVTAHHLRVTVDGDKFRVEAVDSQARFTIQAKEPGKNAVRNATIGPSYIEIGRLSLRLSHQGFPAIIVFDPQSPRFKAYKGLRFFPVDLAYRYELELTPNPKPETTIIMSTRGNQRRAMRVGWFDFMVGGVPYRLEVDRLLEPGVGENDVSIFFRDATTGKETYSVGRYLDAVKLPNGRYLVDFNNAYNPACAVSDFYNCPIPLPANTLKVAIRAGEMDAHYH